MCDRKVVAIEGTDNEVQQNESDSAEGIYLVTFKASSRPRMYRYSTTQPLLITQLHPHQGLAVELLNNMLHPSSSSRSSLPSSWDIGRSSLERYRVYNTVGGLWRVSTLVQCSSRHDVNCIIRERRMLLLVDDSVCGYYRLQQVAALSFQLPALFEFVGIKSSGGNLSD